MLKTIMQKAMCFILPCEDNKYRPKLLDEKILYCYVALLLVLKLVLVPFFIYLPKTSFFADLTKTSLISLTNQARESLGFSGLKESQVLNQAAFLKAQDMLNNDYFSHNSPQGVTPWHWFETAGYNYKYAGENLAIGFIESTDVNRAWLDSPSHRQNILNPSYKEIGIAVVTGEFQGSETTVVVQLFGSLQSSAGTQGQPAPVSETNPAPNIAGEEKKTQTEVKTETQKTQTQTQTQTQTTTQTQAQMETKEEFFGQSTPTEIVSAQKGGQVLSSSRVADKKDDFMFKFFSFISSGYYDFLQKVIYGSLIFVAFLLIITVIFDVFVYHAYQIQYKDIFFKSLVFCVFLGALLVVDRETVLHLVSHGFVIL
jgi:uncharacterized protein YkwD